MVKCNCEHVVEGPQNVQTHGGLNTAFKAELLLYGNKMTMFPFSEIKKTTLMSVKLQNLFPD